MSKDGDVTIRENVIVKNGGSSAVYGLGFLGAAIYFIQHAAGFWMGVLGVLKALVWPAMLIYKALEYLKL